MVLLSLLVFSTGACGSGGAVVVVDPNALFSGTYCLNGFSGTAGAPDLASTIWGTLVAGGAGSASGMSTTSENGVLSGPMPFAALACTLTAGGRLTILDGGMPFLRGGLSVDGRTACLTSILGGNAPGLFVLGRKSGGLGAASLSGLWHTCTFFYNDGITSDGALWGTVSAGGTEGVPGYRARALSNNYRDRWRPGSGVLPATIGIRPCLAADDSMLRA